MASMSIDVGLVVKVNCTLGLGKDYRTVYLPVRNNELAERDWLTR